MTREDYIKFLFLKRKKKDFFYLMENYKILYYMKGSLVSYGFSIICLIVSVILFFIEINNQKMNNQLICVIRKHFHLLSLNSQDIVKTA